MKIKIDEEIILEFSGTDLKAVEDSEPDFKRWLKVAISNIAKNKVRECRNRLVMNNIQTIKDAGITSIPIDQDAQVELVLNLPAYKKGGRQHG